MSQPAQGKGCLIVVGLVLLAFFVIPAAMGSNNPQEWLDEHYPRAAGSDPEVETVSWTSTDSLDETVNQIIAGTDPDDSRNSGSADTTTESGTTTGSGEAVYLRYGSDWLVRVSDTGVDTLIELDEFDRGYDRHGGVVFLGFWGGHYNKGGSFFRGGGSGFGK